MKQEKTNGDTRGENTRRAFERWAAIFAEKQEKTNGDTRGENTRRAFERWAAILAEMGAASWRRWGAARRVLTYGFEMATDGAAGYDDILNRPEMLRAVECLINDPPEIAQVFLMPNPNPTQGGAVCDKDCRVWILSTFQEWFEGFYTFGGILELGKYGVGEKWAVGQKDERGVWRWGDLSTMRFYMFPACLNLACFLLREVWADFTEKCGLPEFDELKKWLANDRAENKRYYSRMGDLYDCAYSIEQYFDLNTGESNPPKYGGGGVRATDLLLNFRDYLRARQGLKGCELLAAGAGVAATTAQPQQGTPPVQPQQGAAVGGSCAAAGNVGGTADSLLNDNAAQFVTEYKPGISFRFRCNDCEGVTVNIQGLRNADISRVEMLLTKDSYSVDGWCKMPDEWKCPCPSQYKTGSAAQVFFSHLQSKRDVYTDGFVEGNAHLFRLSPVIVKRRRGGDNTGAAGVGAGRGNKKE